MKKRKIKEWKICKNQ